jgi:prepilin-type N-terminal cleavage/methylation domain-containing protein
MNRKSPIKPFVRKHRVIGELSDQYGITLMELMISLAIGSAVLAAALNTFSIAQAHADRQYRAFTLQQDLRLGLEVFEQEARLARADSMITIDRDEFEFGANLGAHRTRTTAAIVPGQSVLAVQDGSGWGEGKTVMVCGPRACESHRLARAGQRSQLILAEPVGSSFAPGTSVEVHNRVVYYIKRDGDGTSKLMRMVDGGASVLIGGLDDLRFSYWDETGKRTNQLSQVKRIVLELKSNQPLHSMVREVSVRS